jgi:putative glutamine amidotransferase
VINVALGGSLYQDIELLHPEHRVHRNWDIYDGHSHEVAFEPDSWIARWYGEPAHPRVVNSVHHQGLNVLGRDLVIEARSVPDGVIEAVRYVPRGDDGTSPWMYGVQWHPEFSATPGGAKILDPQVLLHAFLKAVNERR